MTASIDATWPGFVPHVTCGVIVAASSTTSLSHTASSSEYSVRQSATAASQFVALRRMLAALEVLERGVVRAIMPALAPASIDMLQTVIRPSIDSARIADPRYSMTWPMPPPVPISPRIARMMSLAVEPPAARRRR